jgi:hypothetical protein
LLITPTILQWAEICLETSDSKMKKKKDFPRKGREIMRKFL